MFQDKDEETVIHIGVSASKTGFHSSPTTPNMSSSEYFGRTLQKSGTLKVIPLPYAEIKPAPAFHVQPRVADYTGVIEPSPATPVQQPRVEDYIGDVAVKTANDDKYGDTTSTSSDESVMKSVKSYLSDSDQQKLGSSKEFIPGVDDRLSSTSSDPVSVRTTQSRNATSDDSVRDVTTLPVRCQKASEKGKKFQRKTDAKNSGLKTIIKPALRNTAAAAARKIVPQKLDKPKTPVKNITKPSSNNEKPPAPSRTFGRDEQIRKLQVTEVVEVPQPSLNNVRPEKPAPSRTFARDEQIRKLQVTEVVEVPQERLTDKKNQEKPIEKQREVEEYKSQLYLTKTNSEQQTKTLVTNLIKSPLVSRTTSESSEDDTEEPPVVPMKTPPRNDTIVKTQQPRSESPTIPRPSSTSPMPSPRVTRRYSTSSIKDMAPAQINYILTNAVENVKRTIDELFPVSKSSSCRSFTKTISYRQIVCKQQQPQHQPLRQHQQQQQPQQLQLARPQSSASTFDRSSRMPRRIPTPPPKKRCLACKNHPCREADLDDVEISRTESVPTATTRQPVKSRIPFSSMFGGDGIRRTVKNTNITMSPPKPKKGVPKKRNQPLVDRCMSEHVDLFPHQVDLHSLSSIRSRFSYSSPYAYRSPYRKDR